VSSPAAIECELHSTLTMGDSTVIFGRVRLVAISESVLRDGRPAIDLLAPLSRLGGSKWASVGAVRRITRLGYEKWNQQRPTAHRT